MEVYQQRQFTPAEIDDLIDRVLLSFPPPSAHPWVTEQLAINLRNDLRTTLSRVQTYVDYPGFIEAYSQQILLYYRRSRSKPGTPIGFAIAGSLANEAFQRLLNGKRGAYGQAGDGFDTVRRLMTLNPAEEVVRLFFFGTYQSAKDLYQQKVVSLQAVYLADIIDDKYVVMINEREDKSWRTLWQRLTGEEPDVVQYPYMLLLYINVAKAAQIHMTLSDIAQFVTEATGNRYLIIPSPTAEGILEVYIGNPPESGNRNLEIATISQLTGDFNKIAKDLLISGVDGVVDVAHGTIDIEAYIREFYHHEIFAEVPDVKTRDNIVYWECILNESGNTSAVTSDDIIRYARKWKGRPLRYFPQQRWLEIEIDPATWSNKEDRTSLPLIEGEKQRRRRPAEQRYPLYYLDVVADVSRRPKIAGEEIPLLVQLLSREDVWQSKCWSNHPTAAFEWFGIEAGRATFLVELTRSSQPTAHDRHRVMADTLFCRGFPAPITEVGMRILGLQPLAEATFRAAAQTIERASGRGFRSDLASVSERLMFGMSPFGAIPGSRVPTVRDWVQELSDPDNLLSLGSIVDEMLDSIRNGQTTAATANTALAEIRRQHDRLRNSQDDPEWESYSQLYQELEQRLSRFIKTLSRQTASTAPSAQ